MLLWLAQHFQDELGPLRVFNFITFRAVFATLTALAEGFAIRDLEEVHIAMAALRGRLQAS